MVGLQFLSSQLTQRDQLYGFQDSCTTPVNWHNEAYFQLYGLFQVAWSTPANRPEEAKHFRHKIVLQIIK